MFMLATTYRAMPTQHYIHFYWRTTSTHLLIKDTTIGEVLTFLVSLATYIHVGYKLIAKLDQFVNRPLVYKLVIQFLDWLAHYSP